MRELKLITKILHNKHLKKDPYGALHMPVYNSVAFESDTAEELELIFQGKKYGHTYSRITNPTVENFEQKVAAITDAKGVVALSSGMAAISNLVIAVARSGDNIITSKHLFGNTLSLFERTLKEWGLKVKYADMTDTNSIEALIDSSTRAIFLETITNPQLEVADIKAISNVAKQKDVLLIADTTMTPPCIFNSKEHGVDVEVISSTKFISGGATTVGGLIIDNGTYDWKMNSKLLNDAKKYGSFALISKLRTEVFRNLGSCMSPYNAFMQSVGFETLPLRVDVSCANSMRIAEFLQKSDKVNSVHYPGLKTSIHYETAEKQFKEKPGALLTFDLESKGKSFIFMDALKVIRRATNINDNRSLIIHPASTIFCEYNDDQKKEMDIRDTMIRLSVGIEDSDDLIMDIKDALSCL